jgi:hypothetical protein
MLNGVGLNHRNFTFTLLCWCSEKRRDKEKIDEMTRNEKRKEEKRRE